MTNTGYKQTKEHRAKISESMKGKNNPNFGKLPSEETRAKMSAAKRGKKRKPFSKETRAKMRAANIGKTLSRETRAKVSATVVEHWKRPEYRAKISTSWTPEKRAKISAANTGENNPMKKLENKIKLSARWQGISVEEWTDFKSFEPYCSLFNYDKKEEIRNRDNRTCVFCGKSEILNGRKLDVHHIDGSKTQGCSGEKWYLCALCCSCNTKTDTLEKEFLIVSNLNPQLKGGK